MSLSTYIEKYHLSVPKKDSFNPTNWFICSLSKEGFHNWQLCKSINMWGIPSNGRNRSKPDCKSGDGLIVYAASRGFVAICEITGAAQTPSGKDQAPWAGGIFRYGTVIPFRIKIETKEPKFMPFINQRIEGCDISTNQLRRGFALISKKDGEFIQSIMAKETRR